jgi:hypothetical protein
MVQAITGEGPGSDIGGITTNMNEVLRGFLYSLPADAGIVGLPQIILPLPFHIRPFSHRPRFDLPTALLSRINISK